MPRAYFIRVPKRIHSLWWKYVQPDVYYDMMGIAMGLQAAPLSGNSNERARGVGGHGIKY